MAPAVLLVDDQPEFLSLARALLSGHPDLIVIGEATTCDGALALLPSLSPDVVILDVQLLGMSGFEAAKRLADASPGLLLIMVSAYGDPQYEQLALAAGALAFLPKKELSAEAVMRIVQGI
jgi:two-component system invasion response regulator UvrY